MKNYIRPTFAVVEIDLTPLMVTVSLSFTGGETSNEEDVQASSYRSNLWSED